jgi:hypothetical protein
MTKSKDKLTLKDEMADADGELNTDSTVRIFRTVQIEGTKGKIYER